VALTTHRVSEGRPFGRRSLAMVRRHRCHGRTGYDPGHVAPELDGDAGAATDERHGLTARAA